MATSFDRMNSGEMGALGSMGAGGGQPSSMGGGIPAIITGSLGFKLPESATLIPNSEGFLSFQPRKSRHPKSGDGFLEKMSADLKQMGDADWQRVKQLMSSLQISHEGVSSAAPSGGFVAVLNASANQGSSRGRG